MLSYLGLHDSEYLNIYRTIIKIVMLMRRALAAMMILSLLLGFTPPACATDDSMKVLLFLSDPAADDTYKVGDDVAVDVMVFDKGQLTDPDTSPTVTLNPYQLNEREIAIFKNSKGAYGGNFTIMEDDVCDSSIISIQTEATLGKENETDLLFDEDIVWNVQPVSGEGNLYIKLEIEDYNGYYIKAFPGETINMTITVENNQGKVNPEDFELTANDEPISYTNPISGVFKANYTVGPTVSESTFITIYTEARNNGEVVYDVAIIIINFFSVWYHRNSVTDTYAQFEIGIADIEGKAISGADINFNYEIDNNEFNDESPSKSGTTDTQGKGSFTISYDSASYISINGSAEFSGKTQNFQGNIYVSEKEITPDIEEPSPDYDFQVIYQENEGELEPNEMVTLEYISYEEAKPLPNQLIYFYIHTAKEFIKCGSTTTDSNGRFTITFMTPEIPAVIMLKFESPFEKENSWENGDSDDGLLYREDLDIIIVYNTESDDHNENITIETAPLKIGGNTKVTVSTSDFKDYLAFAWIIPGEYPINNFIGEMQPEWLPWIAPTRLPEWLDWTPPSALYNFLVLNDGKFTGEILLPEFLPKDETYTVIVIFENPSSLFEGSHWNYAYVTPGDNVESDDEEQNILLQSPFSIGGFGISWLAIIIIFVIIFVSLFVKRKRRKKINSSQTIQKLRDNQ
jgi:hypothetical protein